MEVMIIGVIFTFTFILVVSMIFEKPSKDIETKEEYVKEPIQEEIEEVKEIKTFYFPKIKEVNIDKVDDFDEKLKAYEPLYWEIYNELYETRHKRDTNKPLEYQTRDVLKVKNKTAYTFLTSYWKVLPDIERNGERGYVYSYDGYKIKENDTLYVVYMNKDREWVYEKLLKEDFFAEFSKLTTNEILDFFNLESLKLNELPVFKNPKHIQEYVELIYKNDLENTYYKERWGNNHVLLSKRERKKFNSVRQASFETHLVVGVSRIKKIVKDAKWYNDGWFRSDYGIDKIKDCFGKVLIKNLDIYIEGYRNTVLFERCEFIKMPMLQKGMLIKLKDNKWYEVIDQNYAKLKDEDNYKSYVSFTNKDIIEIKQ